MSVGLLSVGELSVGICPRVSVRRDIVRSGYCPDTVFLTSARVFILYLWTFFHSSYYLYSSFLNILFVFILGKLSGGPPKVIPYTRPQNRHARIGDNVTFDCLEILSGTIPDVRWFSCFSMKEISQFYPIFRNTWTGIILTIEYIHSNTNIFQLTCIQRSSWNLQTTHRETTFF